MKTKIIYISGSEVFDIADIRAAFDEVRAALALDAKTVLFGVPVDKADDTDTEYTDIGANILDPINSDKYEQPVKTLSNKDIPVVTDSEPEVTTEDPVPVEKPKKTRRTHAKVVPITPVELSSDDAPESEKTNSDKMAVPILSVLGTKSDEEITIDEPIDTTPINVAPIDMNTANDAPNNKLNTQHVSIDDMLADDTTPVEPGEKTLEELLESMTPLGEDEKAAPQPIVHTEPVEPEPAQTPNEDTDETLKLLATEFAESADTIVPPTKTETRGKIGKLKNILPFKKAKRDDSGIMGDLFGWAGVANDEDFTIPGFFANASSKK